MNTSSSSPNGFSTVSCADQSAYLVVHSESTAHRGRRERRGPTPLQRLRALCQPTASPLTDQALSLTLADGLGNTVLSLANADPVLGLALAPGTYHLTATRGQTRRGYTVSLPAGARFELHLRFAASEPSAQALPTPQWSARSAN
ncbi:MAG: hypothetical protein CFE40_03730 [Burkholderiales bacterium PBB1]|nr:MAG: hypothetical protein CFE40_03730 [Burkholderiales bacterium PBB1]